VDSQLLHAEKQAARDFEDSLTRLDADARDRPEWIRRAMREAMVSQLAGPAWRVGYVRCAPWAGGGDVTRSSPGWTTGRPVRIIGAAMHAHAASDHQPASTVAQLGLSVLPAAAVVGAASVSIIGIVIIRPSARGVLG
jgi:hypothetical protein